LRRFANCESQFDWPLRRRFQTTDKARRLSPPDSFGFQSDLSGHPITIVDGDLTETERVDVK
jgi:hypothetical protein